MSIERSHERLDRCVGITTSLFRHIRHFIRVVLYARSFWHGAEFERHVQVSLYLHTYAWDMASKATP